MVNRMGASLLKIYISEIILELCECIAAKKNSCKDYLHGNINQESTVCSEEDVIPMGKIKTISFVLIKSILETERSLVFHLKH